MAYPKSINISSQFESIEVDLQWHGEPKAEKRMSFEIINIPDNRDFLFISPIPKIHWSSRVIIFVDKNDKNI